MNSSSKSSDQSLYFISPLSRDLFMRVLDDSQKIWRYYFFQDDNCSFDVETATSELVPSTLNLVYDSFVRLMASSNLNACPTSQPFTSTTPVVTASSNFAKNLSLTTNTDVAVATTVTENTVSSSTSTKTEVNHAFDDTSNAIVSSTSAGDSNDPYQLCFNYDIVRLLRDKFIDRSVAG
ncbi:hypothetical protein KPH14_013133, partial [Odynerus spinipes]